MEGLNQFGHVKIAFVLLTEVKPAQKNQFGFLSYICSVLGICDQR